MARTVPVEIRLRDLEPFKQLLAGALQMAEHEDAGGDGWWAGWDQVRAAIVALQDDEVTHACPPGDAAVTPCCGRTPFELPRTDRMTLDPTLVTCARAAGGAPEAPGG